MAQTVSPALSSGLQTKVLSSHGLSVERKFVVIIERRGPCKRSTLVRLGHSKEGCTVHTETSCKRKRSQHYNAGPHVVRFRV